jgi:hypothetical protein
MRGYDAAHRDYLEAKQPAERFLNDVNGSAVLSNLRSGTSLDRRVEELAGRSVLVAAHDQLTVALALIEVDGLCCAHPICRPSIFRRSPLMPGPTHVSDRHAVDFAGLGIQCHIGAISIIRARPFSVSMWAVRRRRWLDNDTASIRQTAPERWSCCDRTRLRVGDFAAAGESVVLQGLPQSHSILLQLGHHVPQSAILCLQE